MGLTFADDEFEVVGHGDEPALAGEGAHLADVVHVHQSAAMDTAELRALEAMGQLVQRAIGEVALVFGDDPDEFPFGAKGNHFVEIEEEVLDALLTHHLAAIGGGVDGAGECFRVPARMAYGGTDFFDSLPQAFLANGLEQVIRCASLKGAQGVMVVGRHKDDAGRERGETAHHFEAIAVGHLDIEEDQVRMSGANQFDGLRSGAGVAGDLDARNLGEFFREHLAGDRLIVHNNRSERGIRHNVCSTAYGGRFQEQADQRPGCGGRRAVLAGGWTQAKDRPRWARGMPFRSRADHCRWWPEAGR